jgi:hypothetical protein
VNHVWRFLSLLVKLLGIAGYCWVLQVSVSPLARSFGYIQSFLCGTPIMALHEIVYASFACEEMAAAQLDQLLTQCRVQNEKIQITGVLIYHQREFLQLLEGEADALTTPRPECRGFWSSVLMLGFLLQDALARARQCSELR